MVGKMKQRRLMLNLHFFEASFRLFARVDSFLRVRADSKDEGVGGCGERMEHKSRERRAVAPLVEGKTPFGPSPDNLRLAVAGNCDVYFVLFSARTRILPGIRALDEGDKEMFPFALEREKPRSFVCDAAVCVPKEVEVFMPLFQMKGNDDFKSIMEASQRIFERRTLTGCLLRMAVASLSVRSLFLAP